MRERHLIDIDGRVQGVGFRPHVARLAARCGLDGWVANASAGVRVEVEGARERLAEFRRAIAREAPPRAEIGTLSVAVLPARGGAPPEGGFRIAASVGGGGAVAIAPDGAPCPACLAEILDPADPRHRYPFTSCADCGPRYSLLLDTPWDRASTTMARFAPCAACRAEVESPADRRYHAQTNACPDCGPRLELLDADGARAALATEALDAAAALLADGAIVALKGLGGFQLVCDASDAAAVRRLRRRKRRPDKPFAVMLATLETVRGHVALSALEAALLASPEAPIVLLRSASGPADRDTDGGADADANGARRSRPGHIVDAVAPDSPLLGLMLPTTPLHHLLARAVGRPLVVTSGNLSGEPMATTTADALTRLDGIADAWLTHDRPIARALDDSVVREVAGATLVLRRGRGLAPCRVRLAGLGPTVLAWGGDGKSAVCLAAGADALLGEYLGDVASPRARERLLAAAADLPRLNRSVVESVATDSHPDYVSARLARRQAEERTLPHVAVPHHLAHVLAGVAEHALDAPVLGFAWDGAGHSGDALVRGGECLLVDPIGKDAGRGTERRADGGLGWRRVAALLPFALPGGDAAAREPWRAALGAAHALVGDALFDDGGVGDARERAGSAVTAIAMRAAADANGDRDAVVRILREWIAERLDHRERRVLAALLRAGGRAPAPTDPRAASRTHPQAPLTTSAGRLFDAFAALLGLADRTSFEGQAAQALEHACLGRPEAGSTRDRHSIGFAGGRRAARCRLVPDAVGGGHAIDWRPLLAHVVRARAAGAPSATLAREIHAALVDAIVAVARVAEVADVVLTGGCFQNRRLAEGALAALETAGFRPHLARRVPPNDGGLALGQALFARAAIARATTDPNALEPLAERRDASVEAVAERGPRHRTGSDGG